MNWLQQSQDMMKSWMDTQRQMMTNMAQSATGQAPSLDNWEQTMQSWQNAFKNAMETQTLLTRMWARNMTAGMPTEAAEAFTKSVEQMTATWSEMQVTMLNNWFMVMKSMNPTKQQDDSTKALEDWQANMQKMMDVQSEWAQKWMDTYQSALSENKE